MSKLCKFSMMALLAATGFAGHHHHDDADIKINITEGQRIHGSKQLNFKSEQTASASLVNASTKDVGKWSQGLNNSASNSANTANNAMSVAMDSLSAKGKIKVSVAHNQDISCLKQVNHMALQTASASASNIGSGGNIYDNSSFLNNSAANDLNSAVNYLGMAADGLDAKGGIAISSAPCAGGCKTQSVEDVKQKNIYSEQTASASVAMATDYSGVCGTCGRLGNVTDHSTGITNAASNSVNTIANVATYRFTDFKAGH